MAASTSIFATKYPLEVRNPYIVQETNVGKTATKMTATIDFAMQFKKLHESGMQVSNICGCPEFHPSCIPAFLRASSKCVVRLPARKKSGEYSLESSRRDLQNALLCTALESQFFFQNFAKILTKFVDILLIFADFAKILQYFDEISPKFHQNFTRT